MCICYCVNCDQNIHLFHLNHIIGFENSVYCQEMLLNGRSICTNFSESILFRLIIDPLSRVHARKK